MRLKGNITKARVLAGCCLLSLILIFWPAPGATLRRAVRPVFAILDRPGQYVTVHLRGRADEVLNPTTPAEQSYSAMRNKIVEQGQQLTLREAEISYLLRERKLLEDRIVGLTRWREALDKFPCRLVEAKVLSGEAVPLRQRRVVSAGSRSGVANGQLAVLHGVPAALPSHLPVLDTSRVVGRIVDSASYTATLQLVTDPEFKDVPVRIWRFVAPGQSRQAQVARPDGALEVRTVRHDGKTATPQRVGDPVEAMIAGDGKRLVCAHVPARHDIRPGDLVTTGLAAQLLPAGLEIGTVTQVAPDTRDAHFVNVIVEAPPGLDRLDEVYIVLPVSAGGD